MKVLIIVTLWLVSLFFLLIQEEVIFPFPYQRLDCQKIITSSLRKESTFGIYFKETKIGFLTTEIVPLSGQGYNIYSKLFLNLSFGNTSYRIYLQGFTELTREYKIKKLNFKFSFPGYSFGIKGEKQAQSLVITTFDDTDERVTRLPYAEVSTALPLFFPFSLPSLRREGYRVSLLNPLTLAREEILLKVSSPIIKDNQKLYQLNIRYQNFELKAEVNQKGEIQKLLFPFGLSLRQERFKGIQKFLLTNASLNIQEIAKVSVSQKIEMPERVSYLKIALEGIEKEKFNFQTPRQKLAGDNIIEIRTLPPPRCPLQLPIAEKSLSPWLTGNSFVQVEHPQIKQKAKELSQDIKNSWEVSLKIFNWVYQTLKKEITFSIPSALEVLKTRRGDCNEHTYLFTALARAAGIPTKVEIGLVYSEDAFYYHAWPSVYVGEWHSLDPTLGQLTVDATHIKFIEGGLSEQMKVLDLIGKLKIKILKIEYDNS
jgi:hypothetical protein